MAEIYPFKKEAPSTPEQAGDAFYEQAQSQQKRREEPFLTDAARREAADRVAEIAKVGEAPKAEFHEEVPGMKLEAVVPVDKHRERLSQLIGSPKSKLGETPGAANAIQEEFDNMFRNAA